MRKAIHCGVILAWVLLLSACMGPVFFLSSRSAGEAEKAGLLVCRLQVEPAEFTFQGKTIRFREAWIQETAAFTNCFGPRMGRSHSLCCTLAAGAEYFVASNEWLSFRIGERDLGPGLQFEDSVCDEHPVFQSWLTAEDEFPLSLDVVYSSADAEKVRLPELPTITFTRVEKMSRLHRFLFKGKE